jgi:hypothetical protein
VVVPKWPSACVGSNACTSGSVLRKGLGLWAKFAMRGLPTTVCLHIKPGVDPSVSSCTIAQVHLSGSFRIPQSFREAHTLFPTSSCRLAPC